MNKNYEVAVEQLESQAKHAKYSSHGSAMKDAVLEALRTFCRQSEAFAMKVIRGGSFEECMNAVAKNVGSSISDLEAFRRAVKYYWPEAEVRFRMEIEENAQSAAASTQRGSKGEIFDLTDFL